MGQLIHKQDKLVSSKLIKDSKTLKDFYEQFGIVRLPLHMSYDWIFYSTIERCILQETNNSSLEILMNFVIDQGDNFINQRIMVSLLPNLLEKESLPDCLIDLLLDS